MFFAVPALLVGFFLAYGLSRRREGPIPVWWWALMVIACSAPVGTVAMGIAYMADQPRVGGQQPDAGWLTFCLLVADLVPPIALVPTTVYLSGRGKAGWKTSLSLTCLMLLPFNFIALLAAGQMITGVSL